MFRQTRSSYSKPTFQSKSFLSNRVLSPKTKRYRLSISAIFSFVLLCVLVVCINLTITKNNSTNDEMERIKKIKDTRFSENKTGRNNNNTVVEKIKESNENIHAEHYRNDDFQRKEANDIWSQNWRVDSVTGKMKRNTDLDYYDNEYSESMNDLNRDSKQYENTTDPDINKEHHLVVNDDYSYNSVPLNEKEKHQLINYAWGSRDKDNVQEKYILKDKLTVWNEQEISLMEQPEEIIINEYNKEGGDYGYNILFNDKEQEEMRNSAWGSRDRNAIGYLNERNDLEGGIDKRSLSFSTKGTQKEKKNNYINEKEKNDPLSNVHFEELQDKAIVPKLETHDLKYNDDDDEVEYYQLHEQKNQYYNHIVVGKDKNYKSESNEQVVSEVRQKILQEQSDDITTSLQKNIYNNKRSQTKIEKNNNNSTKSYLRKKNEHENQSNNKNNKEIDIVRVDSAQEITSFISDTRHKETSSNSNGNIKALEDNVATISVTKLSSTGKTFDNMRDKNTYLKIPDKIEEVDDLTTKQDINKHEVRYYIAKHQKEIHRNHDIHYLSSVHGRSSTTSNTTKNRSKLGGLTCTNYGGPRKEITEEMVFWSDIPSDSYYRSPFYNSTIKKYITFEPDHGGWNNIRMAMETVLVLAHATGRTLVLPPNKNIYLLGKHDSNHKTEFSFNDFFHLDAISIEHSGIDIITMDIFLEQTAMNGEFNNMKPPGNNVHWDGRKLDPLWQYLRFVGVDPQWDPKKCIAAIPSKPGIKYSLDLETMMENILGEKIYGLLPNPDNDIDYVDDPTDVRAQPPERLLEMMANRRKLCIYNNTLQNAPLIHFKIDKEDGQDTRLLVHFYAFVFFQDWIQDLWTKRFIRDHMRYVDEIMCAAARVVDAVRERARKHLKFPKIENSEGIYNSFHVRRGDFQYRQTRVGVDVLYKQSKDELEYGSTLYIATDEVDKDFFSPLSRYYDVTFLTDYLDLIEDVNPNYYGMLDQLVAYKGQVFFGTWWSTLSGYINRMRGYYNEKHKVEGYKEGILSHSFYFIPKERKYQMTNYRAVKAPFYMREFPVSWRDINEGIKEISDLMMNTTQKL